MTPQEQAQYQQILKGLSTSASGLNSWLGTNPYVSGAGSTAASGANALGIASGIQQGGVTGDTSAAANAARLIGKYGSNLGLNSSTASGMNTGATGALDALSLYQGLEKGGVQGYGQAAGAGLQGAGLLTSNPALTTAGGYVLAPLALYNAVKNWQSGNTGSDALQGAEAGAAVGSVVPGIGTVIGGLVGGAAGALSSAFGGGRQDPETANWQSYVPAANSNSGLSTLLNPSQNFQNLSGVMDAKDNTAGHSQPIEQVFGRQGENNLLNQMAGQINSGVQKGTITPGMDASQIYSQVITPWLSSQGAGVANQNTAKGDPEGTALNSTLQNLVSQYVGGQITPTTQLGLNGQTDSNLPSFVGFGNQEGGQSEADASNATTRALYANASPSVLASKLAPVSNITPAASHVSTPTVNLTQPPGKVAEGGYMKRKKGRRRFDDGGDVDYSGSTDYASDPGYTPTDFMQTPQFDSSNQAGDPSNGGYLNNQDYLAATLQDPNFFSDVGDNYNSSVAGGSSGSGIGSALSKLKANATGANGISGILQILAGLTPIAGALARPKTNTNSPTAAPGMTQGATAPKAPMFNRTQIASPTNNASGVPMTQQDWYTYGSRPEAQFFQNNSVPLAQATGVATKQARGGALSSLQNPPSNYGMPEFDSAVEHHVNGPGDGTSDDIPAKLSDGEYVMDANTVSMLGNGSNKAGAERLDTLRQNLRKHAARSMAGGKQFMKAKPPEQYMKGGPKVKGRGKPIAFGVE